MEDDDWELVDSSYGDPDDVAKCVRCQCTIHFEAPTRARRPSQFGEKSLFESQGSVDAGSPVCEGCLLEALAILDSDRASTLEERDLLLQLLLRLNEEDQHPVQAGPAPSRAELEELNRLAEEYEQLQQAIVREKRKERNLTSVVVGLESHESELLAHSVALHHEYDQVTEECQSRHAKIQASEKQMKDLQSKTPLQDLFPIMVDMKIMSMKGNTCTSATTHKLGVFLTFTFCIRCTELKVLKNSASCRLGPFQIFGLGTRALTQECPSLRSTTRWDNAFCYCHLLNRYLKMSRKLKGSQR
jgi:hypothetical protein